MPESKKPKKKPRIGRPQKRASEKVLTPKWQFRLPMSEREEIKTAAATLGEDASTFARRVLIREARKVNGRDKKP